MENLAQIANVFQIVIFFIFGSLIGSFSNVVIFRMVTGVSIVFPPSSCPKCGHKLGFFDLFPVFSWLFLKGKCRYCKEPISIQYPLVETAISLITGLVFIKYRLTLNFISVSSAFIIWFISSVIFFRDEIKSPNPFLWALTYFIGLFWLCDLSKNLTVNILIGIIIFASIVGCAVSASKEKIETVSMGALSLIGMFALATFNCNFIHYGVAAIIAAFLEKSNKTKGAGRLAFFILQIITIAFLIIKELGVTL